METGSDMKCDDLSSKPLEIQDLVISNSSSSSILGDDNLSFSSTTRMNTSQPSGRSYSRSFNRGAHFPNSITTHSSDSVEDRAGGPPLTIKAVSYPTTKGDPLMSRRGSTKPHDSGDDEGAVSTGKRREGTTLIEEELRRGQSETSSRHIDLVNEIDRKLYVTTPKFSSVKRKMHSGSGPYPSISGSSLNLPTSSSAAGATSMLLPSNNIGGDLRLPSVNNQQLLSVLEIAAKIVRDTVSLPKASDSSGISNSMVGINAEEYKSTTAKGIMSDDVGVELVRVHCVSSLIRSQYLM